MACSRISYHPRARCKNLRSHYMEDIVPEKLTQCAFDFDALNLDNIQSVPNGFKRCSVCKKIFPATTQYFSKRSNSRSDGLNAGCKTCRNAYKQAYRATPEGRVKTQQYYIDNHDAIREQQRQSYAEHRDTSTAYFRRRAIQLREGEKLCYGCERIFPSTPEFFPRNKNYGDELHPHCKICAKEYAEQHKDDNEEYYRQYRIDNADHLKEWRELHKDDKVEYDKQYLQTERGRMVHLAKGHNRRTRKKKAQGNHTAQDIQTQHERQHGYCYYCQCKLGSNRRAFHVDHVVPLSRGGSNDPENLVIACPSCNISKHNKMPHEWVKGGRLL